MIRFSTGLFAGALLLAGCASAASAPSSAEAPAGSSSPSSQTSAAVAPSTAPTAPTTAPAAPSGGLYTTAQADRGERIFGDVCATCHGLNEFRGRMFEMTWMAEPVSAFYQHIRGAMPQDNPGSLKPEEYAAVVAWALRLNGRPAGDREIPADAAALTSYRWK